MNINGTISKLKEGVDWKIFLFLLLFLNVKLAIKIPAIALIYLWQFNFQFGLKFSNSRLPLFYPLIMITGIIAALSTGSYLQHHYLYVLATGTGFWCLSLLALHQLKLAVERNDPIVLHRTICLFFLLNALVSLLNLALIVLDTHALNPYTYQGQYQKYFMNTGDYIKGLTFDTSTTNAILNAFGVIYFLIRGNTLLLLLCMAVLLLTASNFINLALFAILGFLFIFRSSRNQKSLIVVCLVFFVVFIAKVSPQNQKMVLDSTRSRLHLKNPEPAAELPPLRITERPDSTLNFEEKREKTATLYLDQAYRANEQFYRRRDQIRQKDILQPDMTVPLNDAGRVMLPKADIHSSSFQHLNTTPPEQRQLPVFIQAHQRELPISGQPYQWSRVPGKVTGWFQTVRFFAHHPLTLIAGCGPGNFSSKLAFRASNLGFSGGYPARYVYISRDFLVNHLDLYLNFFSRRAEFHSLINSPFSVYDQLIAEYGVLGLLAFILFYAGFFAKHWRRLTYGLPLLVFTFIVLSVDYWFEQLSVIVFFELLLLLDIKESAVKLSNYGY